MFFLIYLELSSVLVFGVRFCVSGFVIRTQGGKGVLGAWVVGAVSLCDWFFGDWFFGVLVLALWLRGDGGEDRGGKE